MSEIDAIAELVTEVQGSPLTVHRGISVRLSGKAYDAIHDPAASPEDIAQKILSQTSRRTLGMHWSTDLDQAREFASKSPRTGSSDLPIVLHAEHPAHEDIETRPFMLNRREVHGPEHWEQEVPVRKGRNVQVTGVSWRPHEPHPAADADGWMHYNLNGSMPHTAELTAESAQEPDYKMQHQAPRYDEEGTTSPLHDIEGVMPDYYAHPNWYGGGSDEAGGLDSQSVIQRVRGNPEAKVRVYRALPAEHVHNGINPGDWVGISKEYARQHGRQTSETGADDWPVISAVVKAKHLFNEGYPTEFGYDGPELAPEAHSVSFNGGHNQEIRQHSDGSIRPVQRRAPSPTKGFSFNWNPTHWTDPERGGQAETYDSQGNYAGHIAVDEAGNETEKHFEPQHAGIANELEERLRQKIPVSYDKLMEQQRATGSARLDYVNRIHPIPGPPDPNSKIHSAQDEAHEYMTKRYPQVDHWITESPDSVVLNKIVIPKGQRGQGIGSSYMRDLTDYADAKGKRVELTPNTSFGASSQGRLERFYKGFGFVPNKGRTQDYSISNTMYRPASPRPEVVATIKTSNFEWPKLRDSALKFATKAMDTGEPDFIFHVQASWTDVRRKAKDIRKSGGVRILAWRNGELTGQVQGDTNVYETNIVFVPGSRTVGAWNCGCAWAAYSWGRTGRWKKFEGRQCAHSLALQYEAQAQRMFGKDIRLDVDTPHWIDPTIPVRVPNSYDRDKGRHSVKTAAVTINYMRNNSGMRNVPGFGQNVEPWGKYMTERTGDAPEGWESGEATFNNPLHVEHDGGAWKQRLSEQHGGLVGKELSQALLDKGHDGVITHDKYGIGEMVDLRQASREGAVTVAVQGTPEQQEQVRMMQERGLPSWVKAAPLLAPEQLAQKDAGEPLIGDMSHLSDRHRSVIHHQLSLLPEHDKQVLRQHGTKINGIIPTRDDRSLSINGANYHPSAKAVQLNARDGEYPRWLTDDQSNTILHELGHAMDHAKDDVSQTSLYKRLIPRGSKMHGNKAQEVFAEAYAATHGGYEPRGFKHTDDLQEIARSIAQAPIGVMAAAASGSIYQPGDPDSRPHDPDIDGPKTASTGIPETDAETMPYGYDDLTEFREDHPEMAPPEVTGLPTAIAYAGQMVDVLDAIADRLEQAATTTSEAHAGRPAVAFTEIREQVVAARTEMVAVQESLSERWAVRDTLGAVAGPAGTEGFLLDHILPGHVASVDPGADTETGEMVPSKFQGHPGYPLHELDSPKGNLELRRHLIEVHGYERDDIGRSPKVVHDHEHDTEDGVHHPVFRHYDLNVDHRHKGPAPH